MNTPAQPNPFAAPTSGPSSTALPETSQELAGRGKRLLAAFIDGLVMMVIVIAIMAATGAFSAAASGKTDPMATLIAGVGSILAYVVINGLLLHRRGQTVGKIVAKVRIRRIDGAPTTGMDTIVKRILPVSLIGMIPVVGGLFSLANVLFIFREDRRCLHDLIAGTEVVTAA
jgi:uncharacterized RDD family membrane protein YckC